MLTVIIATLNRSKAINEISLPSLLKQDTADFEVLIWDASEDDLTEKAAENYQNTFTERGIDLRYVRAPRRGSASQRNDAVKEAKGDIVFFIDDDSEVSPRGVSSLIGYFGTFQWLMGAGLPLLTKNDDGIGYRNVSLFFKFAKRMYYLLFGGKPTYRQTRRSTVAVNPPIDHPGFAEWLAGGDMSYRKTVFDNILFDERLERFGGYAIHEDLDFSHRVFLHYKQPLMVISGGHVIHRYASGGVRPDMVRRNAALFYNSRIARENYNKYADYGLISFLWEQRVCRVLGEFALGSTISEIIAGYRAYRKAVREDMLK